MKKLMVVGNDLIAQQAVSLIAQKCRSRELPDCDLAAVLVDATSDHTLLMNHCQRLEVPAMACRDLNSPETLDRIKSIGPDLVFSLGNLQILKSGFLGIPPEGVVNFHNALLPRHAGGNACTWAIFEGDAMHGVTCHYLDRGVDTGDIIAQLGFPIKEQDTAFDLLIRCMEKALLLLPRVLPPLLQGMIKPVGQDFFKRTHHHFKELPNNGLIDFNWPSERVCNLVRAMNLGPVIDEMPRAKTFHRGELFFVEKALCCQTTGHELPGTVLAAGQDGLLVRAGRGAVKILSVRNRDHEPISLARLLEAYGLSPGRVLG